ncbi:aminoglycoside N(3)-acetyltransferase [Halorussus ruber]|uniref:aminoglycoside N(3)-acetyltransferase n=1 Tax=Halorussus ruber TaxID=1126238 RepID=UPI0010923D9E|nr:AAC(3) family N-acetyltransferase [Halorussus ruber]
MTDESAETHDDETTEDEKPADEKPADAELESDDVDVQGEAKAIERTDAPLTVERLAEEFRNLGVEAGDTLLVHSSMSSLGWVAVGPTTVVDALMEVVTTDGTLVMPAHSGQYTDPEGWEHPPVPDDWVEEIRASRPPFRPAVTPTRGMGAIGETFRTYPEARRSRHPIYSFSAWGADAEEIVADHAYDHGLGEKSPLAAVYDREGTILMLGTGHETNTSLHLAEHRADREQEIVTQSAPVLDENGERVMREFEELDYNSDDFPEAGQDFEEEYPEAVTRGRVGSGAAKLLDQRAIVDYGAEWFETNRE